jgi:hypothetical protein
VGLPTGLFAGIGPKIVAGWRARVAVEAPSHLCNDHPDDGRWTLMAAYLHCREREVTDSTVELLIATVHRINAHAETRTRDQFTGEIARKGDLHQLPHLAATTLGEKGTHAPPCTPSPKLGGRGISGTSGWREQEVGNLVGEIEEIVGSTGYPTTSDEPPAELPAVALDRGAPRRPG